MNVLKQQELKWPQYQLILFRFLTIYFVLTTAIWTWPALIPGLEFLSRFNTIFYEAYTHFFNDYIYQVKEELVPTRGSGDTSMGWATWYAQLFLSLVGALIWSVLDRKRTHYTWTSLVIRNIVRYYVISVAFGYGIIKVFPLQMPSPSNSYYATDLGHFSGMRFAWNFIGYSEGYEIFSGLMEVLVGVFLLYRRTIILGALLGMGVFANVFLLNISYDIPVKIFSFQLVIACLFIAANNLHRISNFLLFNKQVLPDQSWNIPLKQKGFKVARIVSKVGFIILFFIIPFYDYGTYDTSGGSSNIQPPLEKGFYSIGHFILNGDTIPADTRPDLHWKDFVLDGASRGSIGLVDSSFRVRYGRSYFSMSNPDSINNRLTIKRYSRDTVNIFKGDFTKFDERNFRLSGLYKGRDTIKVELLWDNRDYQLAKKEFNWLLESVP